MSALYETSDYLSAAMFSGPILAFLYFENSSLEREAFLHDL